MNFYEKVRSDYYDSKLDYDTNPILYRADDDRLSNEFYQDALEFLRTSGVPEKYVSRVFSYGWRRGHSSGYNKVYLHLAELVEIFV